MLNIRTVILSAALVVILMLTVGLVTARTEVVSDPSSDSPSVVNHQEPSLNQSEALRFPLDECFDVPLREREASGCRNVSQTRGSSASVAPASSLSTQELRDILNKRYEYRCCGLPR